MKIVKVLEFSEFPGLRHSNISDDSGEQFYHEILNRTFKECLEKGEKLVLNLDDTDAYAPSFLDEAIGNLVYDFTLKNVIDFLEIVSNEEPHWIKMITEKTFSQWEERRLKGKAPVVTEKHGSWFRLKDGKIEHRVWEIPSI